MVILCFLVCSIPWGSKAIWFAVGPAVSTAWSVQAPDGVSSDRLTVFSCQTLKAFALQDNRTGPAEMLFRYPVV